MLHRRSVLSLIGKHYRRRMFAFVWANKLLWTFGVYMIYFEAHGKAIKHVCSIVCCTMLLPKMHCSVHAHTAAAGCSSSKAGCTEGRVLMRETCGIMFFSFRKGWQRVRKRVKQVERDGTRATEHLAKPVCAAMCELPCTSPRWSLI